MSYEDAIEAMRNRNVQPAPYEGLQEKQQGGGEVLTDRSRRVATVATVIAALGFVALVLRPGVAYRPGMAVEWVWTIATSFGELHFPPLLPAAVLVWSLRRISTPRLGAQLVCRAVWWSNLVVGVLVALNYGNLGQKALGAVIAIACAVALLATKERGLDIREPDHPFAPVRFRGHLLLALVMAAADALTLAFSALLQLRVGAEGWNLLGTVSYAGPTLLAAAVMAVAVWGVYRLRTWALFLNLVANIAIAYFAMEGTLNLSPSVSVTLATTAAIQSFIPVPILAVALGDRNAGQPLFRRLRVVLMSAAVITLAALSVVVIPLPGGDGWVDGPGRAFVRGLRTQPPEPVPERVRLQATSDDLRGRSFDGEAIHRADFSGVDLRGASLRRTQLFGVRFDGADLRNVDFTQADFQAGRDMQPSFEGALVEGADFTGVAVSGFVWQQLAERGLEGVTCPDGTPASSDDGCTGHLGHSDPGFRQAFEFTRTSTKGSLRCGREGDPTLAFSDEREGVLWWRDERFVRLADGSLVSRFTTIRVDEDGRWHVSSELCGDNVLAPVEG